MCLTDIYIAIVNKFHILVDTSSFKEILYFHKHTSSKETATVQRHFPGFLSQQFMSASPVFKGPVGVACFLVPAPLCTYFFGFVIATVKLSSPSV